MNLSIIDPLQGDFPEVIEEVLEHGVMKCIAFNRRGTLLAAGCSDGSCVIWDFETRGISKELRDEHCIAPITSICWSKYGHQILASATDKSLTLWDVAKGEKITHTTLEQTTLHAQLHPGLCTPSECLACPLSSPPVLIDLNNGSMTHLPVSFIDAPDTAYALPNCRNKFADGSAPFTPTAASFSKYGDLIYVGNSKGEIVITSSKYSKVYAIISVPGGAVIKNIVFSRNGRYLLINSNDRTIRVYENLLPLKDEVKVLEEMNAMDEILLGVEKLKAVGKKCLLFYREFQDSVTRIHWKAPCFSGDGEWVVGASASKGEHKLYIWARGGDLVKILEGPKEAITDLAWHPVHPIVVSVSLSGLVYIWAKDYTENWSAFAPDFKELDENEEYVEREDEFDLMPETEKAKEADIEDEEVDIVTVEKNPAFSDSDASQDELCFLPMVPLVDAPEHKDGDYLGGIASKFEESTRIGSPHSELGGQNDQELNPLTSVTLVEEGEGGGLDVQMKRKRKPSEKGMELQVEKDRKPFSKLKSSGKKSETKKISGEELHYTNRYVFEEDGTD